MMASSIDTNTTNCAACGKEGPTNTCNKCNTVKYCNAACKKKHRSKHKEACDKRVAELHDEALFKEHPPREECPICFLPLPLDVALAGDKDSLDTVKIGFTRGMVTKDEYANTLRAYQSRHDEMKSDNRDKAEMNFQAANML